jgi:hypothetical protein
MVEEIVANLSIKEEEVLIEALSKVQSYFRGQIKAAANERKK